MCNLVSIYVNILVADINTSLKMPGTRYSDPPKKPPKDGGSCTIL